jgi:acetyl/propionyl-CoA carboxylase alpha subunit
MFKRILIANRGEIALRVIRTAREMDIETVAVYSDRDEQALHTRMAHMAVPLFGDVPKDTYLVTDKILAAAKQTGAEAIHPGYGFLSENAAFARAVKDAGLAWIGPPASAIEAMGDKILARRAMQKAGVPVVPGTTGTPAFSISALAASFSPMARMALAEGPMKTSPAASTASTKSGFSERKP